MNIISISPEFWFYWFVFCGIIMGGYFVMAFSIFHLLYSVLNQQHRIARSSIRPQNSKAIADDIKLSVLSGIFFALAAACFLVCYRQGYTRIYTEWAIQDLGYVALSYIAVLLLQVTYFYFMHRLSHQPFLYPWVHRGHRQSVHLHRGRSLP